MAAIVAAAKGWAVERQDYYKGLPTEPDLVIRREETMIDGPRRKKMVLRYRVEVVATHDPLPDGRDPQYDDVLKIDISGKDMNQIFAEAMRMIP